VNDKDRKIEDRKMNPEAIFLSLCPPAFGLCGEPACRQPILASGYSSKQLNPTLLVDSE
jgi:hypothetical protein